MKTDSTVSSFTEKIIEKSLLGDIKWCNLDLLEINEIINYSKIHLYKIREESDELNSFLIDKIQFLALKGDSEEYIKIQCREMINNVKYLSKRIKILNNEIDVLSLNKDKNQFSSSKWFVDIQLYEKPLGRYRLWLDASLFELSVQDLAVKGRILFSVNSDTIPNICTLCMILKSSNILISYDTQLYKV
jgi:hypothetical protein